MKDQHKEWVLQAFPQATCKPVQIESLKGYAVRLDPADEKAVGVGKTAKAAWRDAYNSDEFHQRRGVAIRDGGI